MVALGYRSERTSRFDRLLPLRQFSLPRRDLLSGWPTSLPRLRPASAALMNRTPRAETHRGGGDWPVIAVLADAKFVSRLFAVDRCARRMICPGSLAWPYVRRRGAAAETIAETIAAEECRPPPQRSRPRFPATEWPNQNRPPVLRSPAARFADLLSRLHQVFESRIFRRIGKL